ncbi:MAG: hypothetical protein ACTHOP_02565 [Mesorhizobium sp.]
MVLEMYLLSMETLGAARSAARLRLDKQSLPCIVSGESTSMPLPGIGLQAA